MKALQSAAAVRPFHIPFEEEIEATLTLDYFPILDPWTASRVFCAGASAWRERHADEPTRRLWKFID
eukprot:1348576-Amorphochlora_amoeboformis.AAC.2